MRVLEEFRFSLPGNYLHFYKTDITVKLYLLRLKFDWPVADLSHTRSLETQNKYVLSIG